MREAYSLLRQSIIHVEQDDIDFDEEELRGERDGDRGATVNGHDAEDSQDVGMSGMEDTEQSYNESAGVTSDGISSSAHATSNGPTSMSDAVPAPAPPKKRMVITHDKYIALRSLIIMHINQIEQETGHGVDRDDLIDWYLESREQDLQDVEDLEYEKELIMKMLRKLTKVSDLVILLICCDRS